MTQEEQMAYDLGYRAGHKDANGAYAAKESMTAEQKAAFDRGFRAGLLKLNEEHPSRTKRAVGRPARMGWRY